MGQQSGRPKIPVIQIHDLLYVNTNAPGDSRPERTPQEQDRAIGVVEAAEQLDLSEDYVRRNWKKLGGHVIGRRIKFPLSTIQRLVRGGK